MAKVIEFLAMPTHCSRPDSPLRRDSFYGMPECDHQRLIFKDKTVECRSCGREWKDMGTGQ